MEVQRKFGGMGSVIGVDTARTIQVQQAQTMAVQGESATRVERNHGNACRTSTMKRCPRAFDGVAGFISVDNKQRAIVAQHQGAWFRADARSLQGAFQVQGRTPPGKTQLERTGACFFGKCDTHPFANGVDEQARESLGLPFWCEAQHALTVEQRLGGRSAGHATRRAGWRIAPLRVYGPG